MMKCRRRKNYPGGSADRAAAGYDVVGGYGAGGRAGVSKPFALGCGMATGRASVDMDNSAALRRSQVHLRRKHDTNATLVADTAAF